MQGSKGASLSKTRQIWRRMHRDLTEYRELLAAARQRPGYDEAKCRKIEMVRGYEESLAVGSPPPVGVLKGPWQQVCQEFHDHPERIVVPKREKKPPKPPEPALAVACPKCRAAAGAKCRNYLGKGKFTCAERKAAEREAADCAHCGARAGSPCLDFKGRPKEPCVTRARPETLARKLGKKAAEQNAKAVKAAGGGGSLLTYFYGSDDALLAAEGVKKVTPADLAAKALHGHRFKEDSGHAEWDLRLALNWITIRYMRRVAAGLVGAEWEAKLWGNCERVFRTNLEHISSRYCNALTRGEKIDLAHEVRFDPARVKTTLIPRTAGDTRPPIETRHDGRYLVVTETWPPPGFVPVMTYEEFRERFGLKGTFWTAPSDLPEHDDGGLFDRTIGALSARSAA